MDPIQQIQLNGVVGAGGAGFPAYTKLQAKADFIVANGAECEPLISSDRMLMVREPEQLIEGMKIAMKLTGAKKGILAVKKHYHDALEALAPFVKKGGDMEFCLLSDYYPSGDEYSLVYEATGRNIPDGGLPINVGVLVQNTTTLINIYKAVAYNKPVTSRTISVCGEVKIKGIFEVSLGQTYNRIIESLGGATCEDFAILAGGPMMGDIVRDHNSPITKTVNGFIVLKNDHPLVLDKIVPLKAHLKRTLSACEQCRLCTDYCPRFLLGHPIEPHLMMQRIFNNDPEPVKDLLSSFLCCECGICHFACPLFLSPCELYKNLKKEFIFKGVKNPFKANAFVKEEREGRLVPVKKLITRLNLVQYDEPLTYIDIDQVYPDIISIPLKQHIGFPSEPVVKIGEEVKKDQLLALPAKDKLSVGLHSPFEGKIQNIDEKTIYIIRKG